jgi:hypothetical protein
VTEVHGSFEEGERPRQVALAERQPTDGPRGQHQAHEVIHDLRNPEPFVSESTALGEQAQLGMAPGELSMGGHGGQANLAEALVAPRLLEDRHGLSEVVDRPPIVALGPVGLAEVAVHQRLQDDLPAGCGKR